MKVKLHEIAEELGLSFTDFLAAIGDTSGKAHPLDEVTAIEAELLRQAPIGPIYPPLGRHLAVSEVHISGFKAFASEQAIPLRPITLIFGPNSAGKSSILHSLAWAHHAAVAGKLEASQPTLTGDSVHLGDFQTMIHRHDPTRTISISFLLHPRVLEDAINLRAPVRVSAEVGLENDPLASEGLGSITDEGQSAPPDSAAINRQPKLISLSFETTDGVFLEAKLHKMKSFLDTTPTDSRHPVWKCVVGRIAQEAFGSANKSFAKIVGPMLEKLLTEVRFDASALRFEPAWKFFNATVDSYIRDLPPASRRGITRSVRSRLAKFTEEILNDFFEHTLNSAKVFLSSMVYLGPIRSYPDRWFSLRDEREVNWVAGGGHAWDLLLRERSTRDALNAWFASLPAKGINHLPVYEFREDAVLPLHQAEAAIDSVMASVAAESSGSEPSHGSAAARSAKRINFTEIANRLKHALGSQDVRNTRKSLVMIDRGTDTQVSARDVGVGVSQCVPVIVYSLAHAETTLLIEQPEVHIHPSLQAELGDIFIASAIGEQRNRFILETHSEHLILRLLRRIRQSTDNDPAYPPGLPKLGPEDVSVLYVEPSQDGAKIRRLKITADGDFADEWPDGFFMDRGKELF